MSACAACLRRARLLALAGGGLEVAHSRRRPVRDVMALNDDDLIAAVGGREQDALRERYEAIDPDAEQAAAHSARLDAICRHDAGYPARLTDDRSAPAVLFVRGGAARFAVLLGDGRGGDPPPAVAIVGTRKASPDGLEVAQTLGRGMAASGVTVVSGMALGIDSAAHAGALEVNGPTVAVLAGGADLPYPASKRALYERIVATGGAVVSEMPPGFRAFRWNFPARNRIIAALAPATVVVEAAERSGSLITADLALDLGREVAAVPGPVGSWRSTGTNALLRDGATLIRGVHDALDMVLGAAAAHAVLARAGSTAVPPPPDLAPQLMALLAAVEDGRDTITTLAPDPAGAATVRAHLMELELLGLVRRGPAGRISRTRPTIA
jgi:DNA processing protein